MLGFGETWSINSSAKLSTDSCKRCKQSTASQACYILLYLGEINVVRKAIFLRNSIC